MAEQKNQNEHLNVEDALTQSEAFLIKYKNAIIGGVRHDLTDQIAVVRVRVRLVVRRVV